MYGYGSGVVVPGMTLLASFPQVIWGVICALAPALKSATANAAKTSFGNRGVGGRFIVASRLGFVRTTLTATAEAKKNTSISQDQLEKNLVGLLIQTYTHHNNSCFASR